MEALWEFYLAHGFWTWIAFGAVAGTSMLNKNLLVLLGVSLLAGFVIERRWSLLVTPWLLGGVALASGAVRLPRREAATVRS